VFSSSSIGINPSLLPWEAVRSIVVEVGAEEVRLAVSVTAGAAREAVRGVLCAYEVVASN
jgi:hypothetical protein